MRRARLVFEISRVSSARGSIFGDDIPLYSATIIMKRKPPTDLGTYPSEAEAKLAASRAEARVKASRNCRSIRQALGYYW